MEIKPGYKQTEIGVIPEDWDVNSFSHLFDVTGGFSASRDQLSSEGYCYLHYGDIHKSLKTFIDVRAEYSNLPKLNISLKRISPGSLLLDGDVVFVDASEDDDGASRHIVIINKDGIPYISGLHTIVAKNKTDILERKYLRYCFQTRSIKQQFLFYAVGTKVTGISKTNIAKLLLPIPSICEQKAIAATLSDMDSLLAVLDSLIAKKRLIKQGTMQELLTKKRRLSGFMTEWSEIELGKIGRCYRGVSYNPNIDLAPNDTGSTIRLLRSNNVQSACIVYTDMQYVNSDRVSFNQHLQQNDVLICMANGSRDLVGKAGQFAADDGFEYTFGAFMGCFRPNDQLADPNYLFYLFQSEMYRTYINIILAGSSINNLTPNNLEAFVVQVPSTKNEQTAIANILRDMDVEIVALEQKREKTRLIKQGMMQELLTGRIRLI